MAFDDKLAGRVRKALNRRRGLTERKMFGGIGFMLNGNMACGVHGDHLIVRLDPDDYEDALSEPGTRPFDLTGRPMKGWVYVDKKVAAKDKALSDWVRRGAEFAKSLPKK
jgi:TfoX/Sxy family transcriptional regulator of competence genes